MKIGDLLLLKGVINKKQLEAALRKQSEYAINYDKSVPLGKVLIEKKYITVDEVTEALNDQKKNKPEVKKEKKVMPTEIGEKSKVTIDVKFLATIGVIIVSACATYFSITGQVDDNKKEIENIKSMGDLKIISYKMDEYSETFKELKELATILSSFAIDVTSIKTDINNLKNKKAPNIDLSGIEDCKDKLDALSLKIGELQKIAINNEERINKLEKRNSGGSRF